MTLISQSKSFNNKKWKIVLWNNPRWRKNWFNSHACHHFASRCTRTIFDKQLIELSPFHFFAFLCYISIMLWNFQKKKNYKRIVHISHSKNPFDLFWCTFAFQSNFLSQTQYIFTTGQWMSLQKWKEKARVECGTFAISSSYIFLQFTSILL